MSWAESSDETLINIDHLSLLRWISPPETTPPEERTLEVCSVGQPAVLLKGLEAMAFRSYVADYVKARKILPATPNVTRPEIVQEDPPDSLPIPNEARRRG
jgi:hypothetical protein